MIALREMDHQNANVTAGGKKGGKNKGGKYAEARAKLLAKSKAK